MVDVAEEEEVEEEAEEDKEVGRRTCCFRCAACLSTAAKSKFSNASSSSSSKKLSTSNGTSALADVDDGGFGSGLAEINVGSGLLLVSALPSLTSSLLSSLSALSLPLLLLRLPSWHRNSRPSCQLTRWHRHRLRSPVMRVHGALLCLSCNAPLQELF